MINKWSDDHIRNENEKWMGQGVRFRSLEAHVRLDIAVSAVNACEVPDLLVRDGQFDTYYVVCPGIEVH